MISLDLVVCLRSDRQMLGPLAQSVEQQTFNLWVVGSIPTGPTSRVQLLDAWEWFAYRFV